MNILQCMRARTDRQIHEHSGKYTYILSTQKVRRGSERDRDKEIGEESERVGRKRGREVYICLRMN